MSQSGHIKDKDGRGEPNIAMTLSRSLDREDKCMVSWLTCCSLIAAIPQCKTPQTTIRSCIFLLDEWDISRKVFFSNRTTSSACKIRASSEQRNTLERSGLQTLYTGDVSKRNLLIWCEKRLAEHTNDA